MPQIPTPLEKEGSVLWGDTEYKTVFRQSTGREDDLLSSYTAEVVTRKFITHPDGSEEMEFVKFFPERVVAEKVRLTIVSCDMEDGGKELFKSDMNRDAFAVSWGKLTADVRSQMYDRCLEVNPDWDPSFRAVAPRESEEDDDEGAG